MQVHFRCRQDFLAGVPSTMEDVPGGRPLSMVYGLVQPGSVTSRAEGSTDLRLLVMRRFVRLGRAAGRRVEDERDVR